MDVIFEFSEEKDMFLQLSRGIGFRDVIEKIEKGEFIDDEAHYNKTKYPTQSIYYVELKGYVYMVPYVKNGNNIFLKTIYPSRKANKKFKEKENEKK